jgi:hypothetical protein
MGKNLRLLGLATLVLLVAAGTAFAGTSLVNYNGAAGNISVSLEAMGTAQTVTMNGTGNTAGTIGLGFTAGQSLAEGNLLVVDLVGAMFPATAINLCGVGAAGGADGAVANLTPVANSTTATFQLNSLAANVTTGNLIFMTNGLCNAAASANTALMISATSSATNPTIQFEAQTAGGIVIDTSTAKRLATVSAEYSTSATASTHTIDYLATPFNGTRLITGGAASSVTADGAIAGASNNVNFTKAARNFAVNTGTAAVGAANAAGLTVAGVVNVQDSASWQGISRLYLVPGNVAACAIGNNVSTVNSAPSGTVSLTVTSAAFNGSASAQLALCVQADGTTSLQTRTLTVSGDVNVTGTAANDPAASAYANAMVWGVNAYQALIPWIINASVAPTYCLINNNDTAISGNVVLDITSSDQTATLANQAMGSVNAVTSGLLVFTADSATLDSGTPVDVSTMGTNGRYSAKVTVAVSPSNVTMACIQTDPISGSKRIVPVLTSGASALYFKQ